MVLTATEIAQKLLLEGMYYSSATAMPDLDTLKRLIGATLNEYKHGTDPVPHTFAPWTGFSISIENGWVVLRYAHNDRAMELVACHLRTGQMAGDWDAFKICGLAPEAC